jgi:hypothetical protein
MNYPAILSPEGAHTLIIFPDLPDCQVIASVNDNLLMVAQNALVSCLTAALRDQGSPPHPSAEIEISGGAQPLVVPVPDDLAMALEARWQWA